MKPTVHILATVRNPELLDAALLVFRTLRVGFPTSPAIVWGNALDYVHARTVEQVARAAGCQFTNMPRRRAHDEWIQELILAKQEPFWICDTDMVFFGAMEDLPEVWQPRPELAGRLEPTFREEWTDTLHVERLHTCLMFIDPAKVRTSMRTWAGQFPAMFETAHMDLIRQIFLPLINDGSNAFYDTCAGLWQAGIGQPFTEQENQRFEHLHCATYVDLISPHLSLRNLEAAHRAIYANPELARGLQKEQAQYYALRAPQPFSSSVVIKGDT